MKELAVKEIHKGTETSKIDLDTFFEQLSTLQQKVRNFNNMEDALKGKTGKAIRSFYNEIHTPFLTFLLQSMEDYKGRLEDMKNDVQSFESSHQGFISEIFLRDELTLGLDNAKLKAGIVTDKVNQTLSSVADIVSVKSINQSDFESGIDKGNRQIATVVNNLNDLDSKHAAKLEETQSDLQTLKKYLSEMTTGLSNGTISVSEFDVASLKGMDSYQSVIQKSYGNGSIEITEENIQYLPLAAIAAARKNTEKGLDKGMRVIISHAYKDLEKGNITRKDYHSIVSIATKKNRDLKKESEKDKTDTLIEYIEKNVDKITQDVSKDVLHNSVQQIGLEGKRIGKFLQKQAYKRGIVGPPGPNGFVMLDSKGAKLAHTWNKYGNRIESSGKVLGKFLAFGSAGWGWYEDVTKKDKTHGEAFTHNGASLLAGMAGGAAGSGLTTIALTALGVSNPAGWAVLGSIAVGAFASTFFNWAYDENILGLQDGLDYVGNKIGEGVSYVGDKFSDLGSSVNNTIDQTGEAIKSGIESLNPMNWGWN